MPQQRDLPIEKINEVTTRYIQTLAGHTAGSRRVPGLIISHTDVRAIRNYVMSALELPCGLGQVRQMLGYGVANIAGLEPSDIQGFHQSMNKHAQTWDGLETEIKTVGTDLVYFSDALRSSGETLIGFVERLEGYRNATGVLGDVMSEHLANMPTIELTARDRNRAPTLNALIEDLRIVIQDCSRSTVRMSAGLSAFRHDLKNRIAPTLGLKLTLMRRHNKDLELARMNAELEELNRQIQTRSESLEDFLERQWCMASFLESLIFPDTDVELRTQLESLFERKRELSREIRTQHALMASLADLETLIQDLQVRVDGAASGASNLESLWMLVQAYIDGSAKRLHNMTDAVFLVVFVARLRSMIRSWTEIKGHSQSMLIAFSDAIDEVPV